MNATAAARPMPTTQAELIAYLTATLEEDRAYLGDVAGLYVLALVPADGSCPIHFEMQDGSGVRFGPYTTARRYGNHAAALRALRGYKNSKRHEGYTLAACDFTALVELHLAEVAKLIADIKARHAAE